MAKGDPVFFGREVRKARVDKDMSQVELQKCLGLSHVMISRIENGRMDPRLSIVCDIARVLGLRVGQLIGEETP